VPPPALALRGGSALYKLESVLTGKAWAEFVEAQVCLLLRFTGAVPFVGCILINLVVISKDCFATSCGHTQSEMNICAGKDANDADSKLNALVKKLSAKISPGSQGALRTAERAWLDFRDKQCAFDTLGSEDGSIHDMVLAQCHKDLTDQQIKQVQQQLNCGQGDVTCGGQ